MHTVYPLVLSETQFGNEIDRGENMHGVEVFSASRIYDLCNFFIYFTEKEQSLQLTMALYHLRIVLSERK